MKLVKVFFYKFSRWMKYNPPSSLSHHLWKEFEDEYRVVAPIRFFIMRVVLRSYRRFKNNFTNCVYWVRHRTTDRYHVVNTGLRPGWHDFDQRLLFTSFSLLVDYIEIECASYHESTSTDQIPSKWWEKLPLYHSFFYRKPEFGVQRLEWESTLDDPTLPQFQQSPSQAVAAREALLLYRWWKEERPNRKATLDCSYDNQGCTLGPLDPSFDQNAPDYVAYSIAYNELSDNVEKWKDEDSDMIIRLAKIRRHLWT